MNRKHLSLAALAVVLVALGIALLPFSLDRNRNDVVVGCSPAALSAWQTQSVRAWSDPLSPDYTTTTTTAEGSTFDPVTHTWSSTPNLDATIGPAMVSMPTDCATKARPRLETSGVLLGLTTIGWLVGLRILRPEAAPPTVG